MASAALTASVRVGRHASAARFGLNLLTHWTLTRRAVGTCANVVRINKCDVFFFKFGTDPAELENVVQQVIESLVKLGAWQQIRGLRTWMGAPKQFEMFKSLNLDLLEAAALQADSKYSNSFQIQVHHITGYIFRRFEDAIASYSAAGQPSPFICNQVPSFIKMATNSQFIKNEIV